MHYQILLPSGAASFGLSEVSRGFAAGAAKDGRETPASSELAVLSGAQAAVDRLQNHQLDTRRALLAEACIHLFAHIRRSSKNGTVCRRTV